MCWLGVNGLLCVVLLYLLGFDRCYGGGYLMVCLKGALFGLWVLPLFLVVNAVLDWRNADTLRGLLHTLTIKKGATGGKTRCGMKKRCARACSRS